MLTITERPAWSERPSFTARTARLIVILITVGLVLYPLLAVLSTSLSNPRDLQRAGGTLVLWPLHPTLSAYQAILRGGPIWHAILVSVAVTGVGTLVSLAVSALAAYALCRPMLGRKWFVLLLVFTYLFPPTLIPTYLTVRALHLLNNYASLVLPTLVNALPVIILQQFFMRGVPEELVDSARLDGAGDLYIFAHITLPLSKAVLAIAALLYAVDLWVAFLPSVLYLNDQRMWPLPMVFRFAGGGGGASQAGSAIIIVSILPIVLLYPWLQRYFFRNVLSGAVRG
ncbi:MAG: carbohydrate ABC transporter permease [Chloroflexi bacterium]|nr:carbohydrate ABC transporter permease [Chloroflexota bacterium]